MEKRLLPSVQPHIPRGKQLRIIKHDNRLGTKRKAKNASDEMWYQAKKKNASDQMWWTNTKRLCSFQHQVLLVGPCWLVLGPYHHLSVLSCVCKWLHTQLSTDNVRSFVRSLIWSFILWTANSTNLRIDWWAEMKAILATRKIPNGARVFWCVSIICRKADLERIFQDTANCLHSVADIRQSWEVENEMAVQVWYVFRSGFIIYNSSSMLVVY